MIPIVYSLQFWTLVAGLLAFTARYYFPSFPLDEAGILALLLFALGLIGIVPQFRLYGARVALTTTVLYNSLPFWQLVAGLAAFVLHYFVPDFPFDEVLILAAIVFVLGLFGITPELRQRGLIR